MEAGGLLYRGAEGLAAKAPNSPKVFTPNYFVDLFNY